MDVSPYAIAKSNGNPSKIVLGTRKNSVEIHQGQVENPSKIVQNQVQDRSKKWLVLLVERHIEDSECVTGPLWNGIV